MTRTALRDVSREPRLLLVPLQRIPLQIHHGVLGPVPALDGAERPAHNPLLLPGPARGVLLNETSSDLVWHSTA